MFNFPVTFVYSRTSIKVLTIDGKEKKTKLDDMCRGQIPHESSTKKAKKSLISIGNITQSSTLVGGLTIALGDVFDVTGHYVSYSYCEKNCYGLGRNTAF